MRIGNLQINLLLTEISSSCILSQGWGCGYMGIYRAEIEEGKGYLQEEDATGRLKRKG